jgi:hypothetical protein
MLYGHFTILLKEYIFLLLITQVLGIKSLSEFIISAMKALAMA